jgi:hypothetical protein
MASSHTTPDGGQWFSTLAGALDRRSGARLARLFAGAVVATGRRTVTRWVRAAGLGTQFRRCYPTLAAAGRRAAAIGGRLLTRVVAPLVADAGRLTLAVDDTPTKRYGPRVQGAGVHHNPTPGPAGAAFVYGHVWVVLSVLIRHPAWRTIALPVLARLYVRAADVGRVPATDRPTFRTKLALGADLVGWAIGLLRSVGKPIWVVADGAYASRPFLRPVLAAGATVVSRLRRNAELWSEPAARRPGQRGRPRVYGDRRVSLGRRAAHPGGWASATFTLYGKSVVKKYKTFVATWKPAGGRIRVVVVSEVKGWRAYFCTDPTASPETILSTVADRFALEEAFRDIKQAVGAGQQQARRLMTNVGAFHVCLWVFVLTEVWAWDRPPADLTGHRSGAPWESVDRRPSHADKRRAWRRDLLRKQIREALRAGPTEGEIQAATERLLDLAA